MKSRSIVLIACMGIAMLIAGCLPVSAATRHIVLLFDERVELPGLSLLEAELVRTLRSNSSEPIEVYREAMDLSRFNSSSYKTLLRDFLRTKYADKKIDVAVAIMAPAFEFLLANGDLIFPGTPIVFCGLDKRQLGTGPLPPNVYGVLIEREFAPTLGLALRLHPRTENVVVVSGSSEFDAILLSDAQEEFRPYEERVSFTYLSELPLKQVLERVSQLSPRSIVLYITMFRDGVGQPFVPHDVVERVSRVASVPVYGFLDQYLGRGIVGGSLYSSSTVGVETAKMALLLLNGVTPPQKFVEVVSNKIAFDWRQMQRWGISENSLPPGSEIDFREITVWQRYQWQIAFVVAVMLVQAGLISLLLFEHRRRQLAEVQSRQRMAELAHVNRFSTAGELTASIAHEINQPLGAILTNAETADAILKSPRPDIAELKDIVKDILHDDRRATEVIQRMRSLQCEGEASLTATADKPRSIVIPSSQLARFCETLGGSRASASSAAKRPFAEGSNLIAHPSRTNEPLIERCGLVFDRTNPDPPVLVDRVRPLVIAANGTTSNLGAQSITRRNPARPDVAALVEAHLVDFGCIDTVQPKDRAIQLERIAISHYNFGRQAWPGHRQ